MQTSAIQGRRDAGDAEECLLCEPASGENCEQADVVEVLDSEKVPSGEDALDHAVEIPVCLAHRMVIEQYLQGRNVAEVAIR